MSAKMLALVGRTAILCVDARDENIHKISI
jgi:hypothetical protein